MGTETMLDYWSLGFWANGTTALGPDSPPGLSGDKCGTVISEAGLLKWDRAEPPGCGRGSIAPSSGASSPVCPSTKSCYYYCSSPPTCESPKFISCNLARTYFHTGLCQATIGVKAYFKANIWCQDKVLTTTSFYFQICFLFTSIKIDCHPH